MKNLKTAAFLSALLFLWTAFLLILMGISTELIRFHHVTWDSTLYGIILAASHSAAVTPLYFLLILFDIWMQSDPGKPKCL